MVQDRAIGLFTMAD